MIPVNRSRTALQPVFHLLLRAFNLFAKAMLALVLVVPMTGWSQQLHTMRGHVPHAVTESQTLQPMSATTGLKLAIGLPLRNQEELDALLPQLSDPASPNFHKYLTPADFTARFGPTEQDYQKLISFATAHGLQVTGTHANRMLLDVVGTTPDIEKTLHVKMMSYRHPVRGTFYAPDREPSLDAQVSTLDISGLDNFVVPSPMGLTRSMATQNATSMVTGSGPAGYFIGRDFRAAYAPGVTLTGSGQVVGLLEFDGFFAGDVTKNFAAAGMTPVPTQTVLVDGVNGAAGADNTEVILDIMMAAYMAPGLSKVIVYEGAYPNDVLNRMATDNLAQQLSSSWGFGGVNATTEQIFKQYIAQGQSFLQASGDSGAYRGVVMTPSDDPNVTVVGGTSLKTTGAGGAWASESTWSGSGGGVSTVYPIPSYQQSVNMSANGGSTRMRNLPDVALTADIQMYLIQNNGQAIAVGGTSAAAPLWAGFVALANQQAATNSKPRVGFLNPLVYAIGNSGNYSLDFNDIKTGSNGIAAVTGYDLSTGWGSPAGQHLINDLTGTSSAPSFTLSNSTAALSVRQGSTGAATLTVAKINGFSQGVNLSVTGLPSGVTAAFSPATATSTSTVTFTATSTAAVGVYSLTVTGTYGSLSSTTPISLTVTTPSFTLSALPNTLTIPQGTTGISTNLVTGMNGFTGNVTLSATGLPAGVTAVFNPAVTATTTAVMFTASSTATPGTYTVTVNGVSGTLRASVTIALTVVAPTFSLSASSTTMTLAQGKSDSRILTVTGQNAFAGTVVLSAAGLPAGVSAVFSPATTTTLSTLTFTASSTVTPGVYAVVVTGVSGTLRSTVTITLTIISPSFTLSASAPALTLPTGTSGSTTIGVTGQNSFTGSVALSATGLPAGVTIVFSPASAITTSVLTFNVAGTAVAGVYPVTVTGTAGTIRATVLVTLTITAPNFTLSFQPATLQVPRGTYSVGVVSMVTQNGFHAVVTLTASGLPAGVIASFGATSALGLTPLTVTASGTAAAGSYVITVTGISGSLVKTAPFVLNVLAAPVGTSVVNLSSGYNVNAFVQDGLAFTGGGLDGGLNGSATAYSASLVGMQQTVAGTLFYFGPANALDATSSATIPLPAGNYAKLKMLATAVNGAQQAQVFKVTYTDGTYTTFSQSLSDWFNPLNFAGETIGLKMAYRNNGLGQRDNRPFNMYEYVFTLNAGKTVASVTLPNNRNVVMLAATLSN